MPDISDVTFATKPKSDQLNYDDVRIKPVTSTIAKVTSTSDPKQPIAIHLHGDYLPYKPCKNMIRVLAEAWGKDGHQWVGRSITLYGDPSVEYGGVAVGGIRISHLSHINTDMEIMVTPKRGKRIPWKVSKLNIPAQDRPTVYPEADFATKLPAMLKMLADGKMTRDEIIARCEKTGKLTEEQKARIVVSQPETTNADDDGIFE